MDSNQGISQANSLLRSAHAIATRKGLNTNWDAFLKQVDKELRAQHELKEDADEQAVLRATVTSKPFKRPPVGGDGNELHTEILEQFKDQLLIVLIKRLGTNADIPVAEMDDTYMDLLSFAVRDNTFCFELSKKE